MEPLYYVISAVLVGWHSLWSQVFDPTSGAAWALSIVGLTLVIRAALIPLFVKQIKSSRATCRCCSRRSRSCRRSTATTGSGSPRRRWRSTRTTGTNPFASCLPILLQMPIFFALFRLLDQAAKDNTAHGVLTTEQAKQFARRRAVRGDRSPDTSSTADGDRRRADRWR